MIKKFAGLLVISMSLAACSGSKPSRPTINGQAPTTTSGNGDLGDAEVPGEDKELSSLELLADGGSAMRFMNGNGLSTVYRRVFPPSSFGFAHCEKDKPRNYKGCDIMFNTDERASMSVFDLFSQRMNRGIQNVAITESMTLNYMRNLRAALGRECTLLINREETAVKEGKATANILYSAESPSSKVIDSFFRKLLDIEGSTMELDLPTADYIKAFEASKLANSDKDKAHREAYINLCITLAMDPQVFLY